MQFCTNDTHENTVLYSHSFPFHVYLIWFEVLTHWHEHMEIIHVLKGSYTIWIDGQSYHCEEDDVIVACSHCLHSIHPLQEDARCYATIIGHHLFADLIDLGSDQTISHIFGNRIHDPFISKNHAAHPALVQTLKLIYSEYDARKMGFMTFVKSTVLQLFILLMRNCGIENVKNENNERFKKVMQYINSNYHNRITITEVAQLINVTPQYFCKLFKNYSGDTFIDFILKLRVNKACELLHNTDLSITEISNQVGFCNVNYFSRIFQRYLHCSAMQFKKSGDNAHWNQAQ